MRKFILLLFLSIIKSTFVIGQDYKSFQDSTDNISEGSVLVRYNIFRDEFINKKRFYKNPNFLLKYLRLCQKQDDISTINSILDSTEYVFEKTKGKDTTFAFIITKMFNSAFNYSNSKLDSVTDIPGNRIILDYSDSLIINKYFNRVNSKTRAELLESKINYSTLIGNYSSSRYYSEILLTNNLYFNISEFKVGNFLLNYTYSMIELDKINELIKSLQSINRTNKYIYPSMILYKLKMSENKDLNIKLNIATDFIKGVNTKHLKQLSVAGFIFGRYDLFYKYYDFKSVLKEINYMNYVLDNFDKIDNKLYIDNELDSTIYIISNYILNQTKNNWTFSSNNSDINSKTLNMRFVNFQLDNGKNILFIKYINDHKLDFKEIENLDNVYFPHSIVIYEFKCNPLRYRSISATEFDKNGIGELVFGDDGNETYNYAIPGTVMEYILKMKCK